MIDEILELSHTIFRRSLPKFGSLQEKSSYLSQTLFEFSCLDRSKISFIDDAVKNLPSFHGLYSSPALIQKCRTVLKSEKLITIKESAGIRIDLPNEVKQLTNIHQEFHSFPFSLNGLVVWIPLTRVNSETGTLKLYERSHNGVCTYKGDNHQIEALLKENRMQDAQKQGSLEVAGRLSAPKIIDANVGDVFIMSALTLHESFPGSAQNSARLICQIWIFDYDDPFFKWKTKRYKLDQGLKQPIIAQGLYDEYEKLN